MASRTACPIDLHHKRPRGLRWRSSYWFATYVIGLGVAVDVMTYSIIIPVIPFQLERLGYTGISALSGWLLFAYSGGLLVSTIPIAIWSEHYNVRKYPMLAGLLALIGSQVMFMEAPTYSVMCIARVLQGISSSVVWVVGLAFLCDATPPQIVGRQLGIAMGGLSFGLVLAPPIGGILYSHFGFRGPFVFSLIAAFIDLVSRFIVIEPKDAAKWGIDYSVGPKSDESPVEGGPQEVTMVVVKTSGPVPSAGSEVQIGHPIHAASEANEENGTTGPIQVVDKPLPLPQVVLKLLYSPRALVALVISFVYGLVYSSQEPALPLHLQTVWGLSPQKVGLILLALSVPMVFSSPLTGWLTDILGAEWITAASMLLAVPWWVVITLEDSLAFFGVSFALQSFFTSGAISPLMAELAAVSRNIPGVGYAHMYGAFNIAYGIGTTIGPIVGGQIYNHLQRGWLAICLLGAVLMLISVLLAIPFTGDKPLLTRLRGSWMKSTCCNRATDQ